MVHNSNNTHTHHGALDGGILGAVTGHAEHNGHTGRDALIGAGAGHIAESHHEKHMGNHGGNQGYGTGHQQTHGHHTGLPAGTPGTVTTSRTVAHAGVGDKIAGKVDVIVGKITNNPVKVAVGEVKQTEG